MAQLVRNVLDGYHDIMDNKSGGLTLRRGDGLRYGREGRLITDVPCHEDGDSKFSRNVIMHFVFLIFLVPLTSP
jgi:hypothetical protein